MNFGPYGRNTHVIENQLLTGKSEAHGHGPILGLTDLGSERIEMISCLFH